MKASIIDEDERGIGVRVVDNNDVEHTVAVGFNGEIQGHSQDGYSDKAAKRTSEENEYNEQARKFAQYYVFQERGYDTVKPKHLNPLRLLLVWRAIDEMALEEFEDHFGDLYQQLQSHHNADTERVIHAPADSRGEDYHLYRKEIYLGLDPFDTDVGEDARELAERYGLDVDQDTVKETGVVNLSDDALDAWTAFSADFFERLDEDETRDLAEGYYIDTVSELQIAYLDNDGRQQVTTAIAPDIEPDARIEMTPTDPRSLEHFKAAVEWELICRIRDYFVRMGVEPPEDFQVLGMGSFEAFASYERVDFYPSYAKPQEDGTFQGNLADRYFGDDSVLGNVRSLLG